MKESWGKRNPHNAIHFISGVRKSREFDNTFRGRLVERIKKNNGCISLVYC